MTEASTFQALPSAVAALSDQELLAEVGRLADDERLATVRLLVGLGEIEERRLHLGLGCSSLFTYCTGVLRLSEHASYRRIQAARVARTFPIILERLASGSLTLTAVGLLSPHLTPENCRALLDEAHHQTKREVEHILARLAPRPDVREMVRRLPSVWLGTGNRGQSEAAGHVSPCQAGPDVPCEGRKAMVGALNAGDRFEPPSATGRIAAGLEAAASETAGPLLAPFDTPSTSEDQTRLAPEAVVDAGAPPEEPAGWRSMRDASSALRQVVASTAPRAPGGPPTTTPAGLPSSSGATSAVDGGDSHDPGHADSRRCASRSTGPRVGWLAPSESALSAPAVLAAGADPLAGAGPSAPADRFAPAGPLAGAVSSAAADPFAPAGPLVGAVSSAAADPFAPAGPLAGADPSAPAGPLCAAPAAATPPVPLAPVASCPVGPVPAPAAVGMAEVKPPMPPRAPVAPRGRPAVVAPLTLDRYKVQLTISAGTYSKLCRVKDLMRHVVPDGNLEAVFDRAITLLLGELERERLAAVLHPRDAGLPRSPGSRHVPAAVKRAVWARDGGRCAFVGSAGRCRETGFLQFHHREPFAVGGETTVENLELRCAAHNAFESELYFGKAGERGSPAAFVSCSGQAPISGAISRSDGLPRIPAGAGPRYWPEEPPREGTLGAGDSPATGVTTGRRAAGVAGGGGENTEVATPPPPPPRRAAGDAEAPTAPSAGEGTARSPAGVAPGLVPSDREPNGDLPVRDARRREARKGWSDGRARVHRRGLPPGVGLAHDEGRRLWQPEARTGRTDRTETSRQGTSPTERPPP